MDLAAYIDSAVRASRAAALANSDQLTLGEIIAKCEAIAARGYERSDGLPPTVTFDFEYLRPTTLDSWRGIYAELALGFNADGNAPSLPDFIAMLRDAVGKTYDGWKGGEYTMSERTPVWVANPGNSGNTAIIDVVDDQWQVILITGYRNSH